MSDSAFPTPEELFEALSDEQKAEFDKLLHRKHPELAEDSEDWSGEDWKMMKAELLDWTIGLALDQGVRRGEFSTVFLPRADGSVETAYKPKTDENAPRGRFPEHEK